MKASIIDLRYSMKSILRALERGESVTVVSRGKEKGIIHPSGATTVRSEGSLKLHKAFGLWKGQEKSVKEVVDEIRAPRHPRE